MVQRVEGPENVPPNHRGAAMPLLDHFRPPLSQRRHWDSFHGAWAEAIAIALN
jgi:hypothetical protein